MARRNIELPHPDVDFLAVQQRAFNAGIQLRANCLRDMTSFPHERRRVSYCLKERDELLPHYVRTVQVWNALTDYRFSILTPEMAYDMVGKLLKMLGAKDTDNERLNAMVEIATESIGWCGRPKPFVLEMVRQHFRDNWKWNNMLQPADFRLVLLQKAARWDEIVSFCYDLRSHILLCDAVLLRYADEQWYAPYRGRAALCRHMLQQHAIEYSEDESFQDKIGHLQFHLPALSKEQKAIGHSG